MENVIRTRHIMPPEMKEELRRRREAAEIYNKLHPDEVARTKFPPPRNATILILPEGYTGRQLKKYKELVKNRDK